MESKVELVIIQPASWDRVQSGVWYKPHWLYASARVRSRRAAFYEDADLYTIDEAFARHPRARFVVDLSSYPQVDLVKQVHRERQGYDLGFMGLDAVLNGHGIGPLVTAKDYDLSFTEGAFNYHQVLGSLRRRQGEDYDGHLAKLVTDKPFEPAFLSVGCDRKCGYCYVGYTDFPRGCASLEQVEAVVRAAAARSVNLHFYDEDFFQHPELKDVLAVLWHSGVKWIALATSVSLSDAIKRFGAKYLVECGNVLNEVGVETADPDVLDKRQDLQTIHDAQADGINAFWLTVTFFPKERLSSRFRTGRFLKRFGYGWDDMVPRLRGNSTHGGLGQFYVPYHGTPWWGPAVVNGAELEARPTRLWPSYVPSSFLQDVPERTGAAVEDRRWLKLYRGVSECWEDVLGQCDGVRSVRTICGLDQARLISMAQLAQLGVVNGRKRQ